MDNDPRCCGSGTCIIDAEGHCWCGQRWDGRQMCRPPAPGGGVEAGAGARGKDDDSEAGEGSGDGGGGGD